MLKLFPLLWANYSNLMQFTNQKLHPRRLTCNGSEEYFPLPGGVFSGSMLIFRGVSNGILGKISSFHNLSSTTRTILCASKKSFHPSSFSHALLWPGFLRSKKCVKSCAFSSFQLLPIFCVTRSTNNYIHDYTWIC